LSSPIVILEIFTYL
jgi:ATPase subunit of ABC transporter with duplicated ATPase domains